MNTRINLKPTLNTVLKFIFYSGLLPAIFLVVLFVFGFLYNEFNLQRLASNGALVILFLIPIGLSLFYILVILFISKVEIDQNGIYKKGLRKYGYKDIIPWGFIKDISIYRFKSGRFLQLKIRYKRNALSRNGSKAIDETKILLSVKLAPFSDNEIIELINKVRRQQRC